MFYFLTFLVVIPSPVLMFISSEAWLILVGLTGQRNWVLLALCVALGQTVGFSLLYFFGERYLHRIPPLKRAVDRFDMTKFKASAPWLLSIGSLVGVPPHNVMCTLSPLVGVRFGLILTTTLIGRCTRYLILAGTPVYFAQYIDTDWIPAWIRALV